LSTLRDAPYDLFVPDRLARESRKMTKSYWLAVLAYLLPTFPLGYAWHLVTFREAYDRLELLRPEVIIPFGLVSMLIQAAIFAWAYPRLFSTRRHDRSVCDRGTSHCARVARNAGARRSRCRARRRWLVCRERLVEAHGLIQL
jgi:hypothetical protein